MKVGNYAALKYEVKISMRGKIVSKFSIDLETEDYTMEEWEQIILDGIVENTVKNVINMEEWEQIEHKYKRAILDEIVENTVKNIINVELKPVYA
jgi:hypothetical protein